VTLSEGGRRPATFGTYMRDVEYFLLWLTAEGDLEKTPTIPKVSQPLRHPEVLTESEYKHLVAVAERQHPRAVLILRVMGEPGLRASEVTALRERDLLKGTLPAPSDREGRQMSGWSAGRVFARFYAYIEVGCSTGKQNALAAARLDGHFNAIHHFTTEHVSRPIHI
jgi:hypothetical protein